jgi:hypothetical protein
VGRRPEPKGIGCADEEVGLLGPSSRNFSLA